MATDKELRDQAVAHLKQTTTGYLKSNGQPKPPPWPEGSTHWKSALDLLAQIGGTTPVPPSGYPASYTNGPLGSKTPLPDKGKVFLINFYGGIGTSWAQSKIDIAKRESDIGRKFDGLHVNYGSEIRTSEGDIPGWIIGRGQLPCITWEPTNNLTAVNNGSFDSQIDAAANHFKGYAPNVIMVRPFREFNLSFLGYGTGQPFIDAWRRIVDRFKARGADNVGFWWTPDEGTDRAGVNASWPGDSYVDWSGCDQYNMFLQGQTTPLHPGYAEFWEIVHYGGNCQHDLWGPKKAFVIGETGTHVDPNNPARKGDWWRGVPKAIRGEVGNQGPMEYMCGISFYDADVSAAEGPNNNFRVDVPTNVAAVYQGWKDMCADPIWQR